MENTIEKQKIKTYLPIFSGFYNSIWEMDDQNILYNINEDRDELGNINNIDYDNLEIDYSQYEIDISKKIVDQVAEFMKDYILSIDYEKLVSPKEYNFRNDSIDVIIEPNIDNIREYIFKNKEQYELYLKRQYTSCDGFISHYSKSFDDWMEYTDNFTDFSGSGHYLGSVLEFIAENESITELNVYYHIESELYLENYISNYDQCIQAPVCSCCNKFIDNNNIIDDLIKYKKITNKNPSKILCDDCIN